jgi:hypothetical protein
VTLSGAGSSGSRILFVCPGGTAITLPGGIAADVSELFLFLLTAFLTPGFFLLDSFSASYK